MDVPTLSREGHQFSNSRSKDLVVTLVRLCNRLVVFVRHKPVIVALRFLNSPTNKTSLTDNCGSSYPFLRVLRLLCSDMTRDLQLLQRQKANGPESNSPPLGFNCVGNESIPSPHHRETTLPREQSTTCP